MSWEDEIRNHFEWARIQNEREELLLEIYKGEDEEEADLYLMQLHLRNQSDLEFFPPKEREQVIGLLIQLINDTVKHRELLDQAAAEIEEKIQKEKPR